MPPARNLDPGYAVVYPNRRKIVSRATKAIVILILLASVGLILIVTIGAWSKLQGMQPVNFAWCIAYLLIAVFVARWARGLLPIAAGLALLLLIIALIAGTGVSGASWFDRSYAGFGAARDLFGGPGLSPDTTGLVVLLIAPVQFLLIVFAMGGFAQRWNVEAEVPIDEARRGGHRPVASHPGRPAAA
ncbi:MAG: hypothetical protein ACR2QA_10450 [Solirubrobacteraceae bacterium]